MSPPPPQQHTTPTSAPHSPNFQFLATHQPVLVRYATLAERYLFDDPSTALVKLRQFAELLARLAVAEVGVVATSHDDFAAILAMLRDRRAATVDILDLFHGLRKAGNAAAHEGQGTRSDALHHLRMARQLAVWFHRSFGTSSGFSPGPFLPPPDPAHATRELHLELDRLRTLAAEQQGAVELAGQQAEQAKLTAAQEADLRRQAEERATAAYLELNQIVALAGETETLLAREKEQLATLQARVAAQTTEQTRATVEKAQQAATLLDLDEAATRRLIDQHLRENGWEADTELLTFKNGVRPQKGKNLAIAEWPTASGPADYVFFTDLTPIAAVEAKKAVKDVPGAVEQAKRYSRDLLPQDGVIPVGPWGEYKVPFCFSTNGRPFLRQIQTKSGIWFLDARLPTNLSRPLEGWYSPAGLRELLAQNVTTADQKLKDESPAFLPLREYQLAAVRAAEGGVAAGRREMLLAMATGTGKTRMCIGLIYRLVKAGRFRRVLFLVDRSALGEQTGNAFKDVKLENFLSFTEMYDVKELGDLTPDKDTKVHIATVQGMVKRILFPGEKGETPSVDAYDCVIVDECHRGYSLDKELSDTELTFRDEADYVSKYRRVLDHFDAVKIGLTATPALHTVEIFGPPIYSYSYRQAVIDGYLVDHEPPIRIVTRLAEDGITWKKGETIQTYLTATGEIDPLTAPDEVQIEVEEFNRRVLTENFNRVVCEELARQIDPSLPGKTVVFCANDAHADLVVDLLKKAFEAHYGSVEDDAVVKITAAADKPLQKIRRLRNERLPNVAVTVDLLSTGIDVPEITNLVFLRRVRSRILYEQMLGRATRLCEEIGKERFLVFDAVDIYAALEPYSSMKPVVVQPTISFGQLARELSTATTPAALLEVHDQFIAKLQRKRRVLTGKNADDFEAVASVGPAEFSQQVREWPPEVLRDWLVARPKVVAFLDRAGGLDPRRIFISDHADELRRVERGYGAAAKPGDYLESFRQFVTANLDKIPALLVVAQRPRDLTRQQLRELKLALDEAGFTEASLQTAWRETTNQDIAATIIGYVRHVAAGQPLLPYKERVQKAMQTILKSRPWTQPQRKWLERIGKQLEVETVVDKDALDHGQFQAEGGFTRLNKVFDGKLEQLLNEITDAIWSAAA
ncbi:MAG: type I restriction-modification system endonuclease [Planctomycetaceae bacterium]|nr:type I restriction-modification system endonuclease [Planctomycetaceae bacterium]